MAGSGEPPTIHKIAVNVADSPQGSVNCLAVRLELDPGPNTDLEDSNDPRYLSLASADYPVHRGRVSRPEGLWAQFSLTSHRLPGSPMWLLSAYSDGFATVNKYWIPAAW